MRFQDWIGKRSQLGHQCREERIQALTDQYWQAKISRKDGLAKRLKDELNVKYDTVVMENTEHEIERLLEAYHRARSEGRNEYAANLRRILSDKYDIAMFT